MNKEISQKNASISAIIPAFNEAKTVCKVIEEVLKLREVSELILVNDASTDQTETKIKKYKDDPRFICIRHNKNKGKGDSLRDGIAKAKNEVILLLDADLRNITSQKIRKIFSPVLRGEVDVARAGFRRKRGRVTEYAVKPMMKVLFPDINFEQPISGQICAKKNFLNQVKFESRYGVDIGLLFDAIELGQKVIEVDIGRLEHKENNEETITEMSRQVLETMIKKAGLIQHKYRLVVFTLDNTLLPQKSLEKIFIALGIKTKQIDLKQKLDSGDITFKEFIKDSAALLKDVPIEKIDKAVNEVEVMKYAYEVIHALKKRRYQVAIISSNFSPIVYPIAKRLGVDLVDCVSLESHNHQILTGNIYNRSANRWLEDNAETAFSKAFTSILNRAKVKPLQTIMVANSEKCSALFLKAGLSIAFKPKDKSLKEVANKTISILPELLAIME
ncbi:TPA: hypothetical protein DD449_05125 [Candidatus Berkelbacteria bacterium]|uniref:Family 2 glycosyl transferase n=1 Tax=Berkelbacteria bacterium GW2011_GWE1_39_12 TaxID=1618337 RepID=A0A0G4B4V7_9BACT|nr:MAG: family 2 glycosyl transferase [Berkelbacteria bacterium GW2011_GWE1_39_12]HBO61035.1 hypothetical protein [Candidatus Berkelbacteria bacterium]